MRRIWTILCFALLTSGAAYAWSVHTLWAAALARGFELTNRVSSLEKQSVPASHDRPLVFWIGDSTFYKTDGPMYPQIIRARNFDSVEHRIVQVYGMDFFGYFAAVGRALKSHPQLIVVVANLRLFQRKGGDTDAALMNALLPREDLSSALLLPWYARGVTVPRLLLNRLLWSESAREEFLVAEGLRSLFHESRWMSAVDPRLLDDGGASEPRTALDLYDRRITRNHPVTRMMAATVSLATRHQTPILVLIAPVPPSTVRHASEKERLQYDGQMRLLADVIMSKGGEYLDLHGELSSGDFRDYGGHYTARGAQHLADIIDPIVSSLLAEKNDG